MRFEEGLISVIMSNYNTPEEYLRQAVESILQQTYVKFEFIIVDDYSTDHSLEILESYSDPRIHIIKNPENMGITKSLNRALEVARGEFVARMDADDISLEKRFERQVDFLKKHPEMIVCGTGVELFGEGANKHQQKQVCKQIPTKEEFQIRLLFGNHINIIHPTAMFRRKALLEHNIKYDEKYIYAQDYRMWVSCSQVGECQNVPEILFKYRIHDKAVSSEKKTIQMDCTRRIIEEQLRWLNLGLPEYWETIHFGMLVGRKRYDLCYREWIVKLIKANQDTHIFDQTMLENILWRKWAEITYYELYKVNWLEKIRLLRLLPVRYYRGLFEIKMNRVKKDRR